jgi:hypothetical protein
MNINTYEHYEKVAEMMKELEKWADEKRLAYWFDNYVREIEDRLKPIKEYAKEHQVPLFVQAETIAHKHFDDADGYSEEESSYYEESSSW